MADTTDPLLCSTIVAALAARGIDPQQVQLIGTLRHIPAGSRKHYDGAKVQIFKPAASEMHLELAGVPIAGMNFSCTEVSLKDEKAYWAEMKPPAGVSIGDGVAMAKGLVTHHRDLTGLLSQCYEQIEREPSEILKITSDSESIAIDLMHLVEYLQKDHEIFEAFCTLRDDASAEDRATDAHMATLVYERCSLLGSFRKEPCDRALYDTLHAKYRAGNWQAVGFDNFYTWFRESELKYATDAGVSEDMQVQIQGVITSLLKNAPDPSTDWVENNKSLFLRNFKVHPLHREIVVAYLDEALAGIVALDAAGPDAPASPKG